MKVLVCGKGGCGKSTIATLLAFVNLGTDLLYFFIDPRIEYA